MRVCPHPLGQLPLRLSWGFCTSTPESECWGFCGAGVWSGLPLCLCVLSSFQYEVGPTPPSTVKALGAVGHSWVESVLLFLTPYSAGMDWNTLQLGRKWGEPATEPGKGDGTEEGAQAGSGSGGIKCVSARASDLCPKERRGNTFRPVFLPSQLRRHPTPHPPKAADSAGLYPLPASLAWGRLSGC